MTTTTQAGAGPVSDGTKTPRKAPAFDAVVSDVMRWHRDDRHHGSFVYQNKNGAVGFVDGPDSNPGLVRVIKVFGPDAPAIADRIAAALAPPAVVPEEVRRLQEEVTYWRSDLAARLWSLTALYEAAKARGEAQRAADLACLLFPILASYDSAMAGEWFSRCDICGEFVRDGEPRLYGEDISGHARCVSDDGEGDIDPHGDAELARRAQAARAALSAPWPEDEGATTTPSGRTDTPPAGGGAVEGLFLRVPDDLRDAIKALDAVKADVARRREASDDWHLGEGLLHEQIAKRLALDFARAALAAAPAAPEPAAGGGREIAEIADRIGKSPVGGTTLWWALVACEGEDAADQALKGLAAEVAALNASRPILSTPSEAQSEAQDAGEGWQAAVDLMAEHLLEEDYPDGGWTWPTHEDDDGYRGGGYVRIVPPDIRQRLREKAGRVLIRAEQIRKRLPTTRADTGAEGGR